MLNRVVGILFMVMFLGACADGGGGESAGGGTDAAPADSGVGDGVGPGDGGGGHLHTHSTHGSGDSSGWRDVSTPRGPMFGCLWLPARRCCAAGAGCAAVTP